MPAKQITLCMQFYICSTWVNLGKGPNRELWSNSDDLSTVLQGSCDVSSNCHSWCKISRMDTQLVAKLVRLQKINNLSLYPFLSLHTEIGKFHQEYFAIKTAENNEKYQDNNFLFGINANKHVKSTSWTCSRILQNIRHHMADTGLSDSPHPIQQWDVWQSGSSWMTWWFAWWVRCISSRNDCRLGCRRHIQSTSQVIIWFHGRDHNLLCPPTDFTTCWDCC